MLCNNWICMQYEMSRILKDFTHCITLSRHLSCLHFYISLPSHLSHLLFPSSCSLASLAMPSRSCSLVNVPQNENMKIKIKLIIKWNKHQKTWIRKKVIIMIRNDKNGNELDYFKSTKMISWQNGTPEIWNFERNISRITNDCNGFSNQGHTTC